MGCILRTSWHARTQNLTGLGQTGGLGKRLPHQNIGRSEAKVGQARHFWPSLALWAPTYQTSGLAWVLRGRQSIPNEKRPRERS